MKVSSSASRTVWTLTLLLAAIGIAVALRRMLQLLAPSAAGAGGPPGSAELDAGFARHRLLTMVHIVPGMLFVTLAPLQFVRTLRTRHPALHRWMGRLILASGAVIGTTAIIMSPQMAIGGVSESAATMLFGILFLFALARAFILIRRGKTALHREWMIRAFGIGLAVAFVRPIVGIFFAASRITHLTPHDFFGAAFWLGFSIQTIAAEVWVNYTRGRFAAGASSL